MTFMSNVTGNTGGFSGGKTGNIHPFKRQLASLLTSYITYWYDVDNGQQGTEITPMKISSRASLLWPPAKMLEMPGLFSSEVTLDTEFWQDSVLAAASRSALWPSCLAVDTYVWLTYRANTRTGRMAKHISWPMLKLQFGAGFGEMKNFRTKFLLALRRIEQVYPHMNWEEGSSYGKQGIIFRFNRPSIASRNHLALPAVARTIEGRRAGPNPNVGTGVRPDGYYSGE